MHDIAQAAADAARVPSFEEVARRGRRRRTRRTVGVAGAVALAVVGVVGVVQVVGGDQGDLRPGPVERPTSSAPAVSTAPTTVPYWEKGALHVDGHTIATGFRDIRYASGTTVVGRADWRKGSEWFLVDGDRLVRVVSSKHRIRLAVSPDGEVVAWVEDVTESTARRLVVWDVRKRAVIDSLDVPVAVTCCDQSGELFVYGVDLQHRLTYATTSAWLWTPGADPIPIRGIEAGALPSDPWPSGMMWIGSQGEGVYGTVDERGRFRRAGTTAGEQNGIWAPDGRTYARMGNASGTSADGMVVEGPAVDGFQHLHLPAPGEWNLIAWESRTLVLAELRGEAVARCDTELLQCVALDQVPTLRTYWPENHLQ